MNLAFVYIAEAYQCYHGEAIAIELAKWPGVHVTVLYADPDTLRHLRRIHKAFGAPPPVAAPLAQSWSTRLLRAAKHLGTFKHLILRDNRAMLNGFDAIISMENTVAAARNEGITHPKLIYTPHGFGDRAYGFVPRIATFDFVLIAGPKTEARMLANRLIRPGQYALTGSVKLETGARLGQAEGPLFAKPQPTVLYNPHFDPKLTSWDRFIEPMLEGFKAADAFNLIVAPHVKMFRRRTAASRRRWEQRSSGNVLVDTGSDHSVDTTYLAAADIYVGDSSSQVYEFLARPRPCVFLNAHGVDWRNDPSFVHWHLGDVVDEPDQLMDAISNARSRHPLYIARQRDAARATFGEAQIRPAARAAEAILDFLSRSS